MPMYIQDSLRFARSITLRRAANFAKVLASYYLARFTSKPIQWGLPVTISFEPTTACNLRCPECPSGLRAFTRATGHLNTDFFRKTIDSVYRHTMCIIFYFQGEPYLNPAFLDMVQYAKKYRLYTMTSTNGHYLSENNARRTVESGLDRIIISIDGATQETYEQYRVGGKLEKVLDGAKRLVAWKKKLGKNHPHIVFQFLVLRPNEHEMDDVRRLARDIGVDELSFKSAQVYDYENGHPLIPAQKQYARYRQRANGSWAPKHALGKHCWKLWHACVITWDGLVVPCCFDKDAKHLLGDLKTTTFNQLWHGESYRNFRTAVLSGRDKVDICTNCTEGCKVHL